MTDQTMPEIFGEGWRPAKSLYFEELLSAKIARIEILRFVAERHDGHLEIVSKAWEKTLDGGSPESFTGETWHLFSEGLTTKIIELLSNRIRDIGIDEFSDIEVIPRREFNLHLDRKTKRFILDLELAMRRIAYYHTITLGMRMKWQRLMTRTRFTDEHLKDIFVKGMKTPDGGIFGGKGFRSTWQESVVSVASALKTSKKNENGDYAGDIVAPMIRDMGLDLAMGDQPHLVMSAQVGKVSSPMDGGYGEDAKTGGRDLHIGAWDKGVLPPTAPLPIASATITGLALAAKLSKLPRFHVAMIGEGASSSGEWWEALNFAGVRGLPIAYVLQNNQIALDTIAQNQSGSELWADKAVAMGIPCWTIDGSDPAAYFSSIATAREFSLAGGGASLVHVETMRGCGHAHHHDDLYLGAKSGNPPGYVDKELLEYWSEKDPIKTHRKLLLRMEVSETELESMESDEKKLVDDARQIVEKMEWPDPLTVTKGITSIHDADTQNDHLDRLSYDDETKKGPLSSGQLNIEFSTETGSWTYARAIQQAMVQIANKYGDKVVFMGEDMEIAGAFGMNIPLKNAGHSNKLLDMPLSEAIIIHAATGAALSGMRPMAEIQFGGFAALGFNALVNNAAMLRWRWGAKVPLTVRIPLGGKTRSGPFHANMIESWFSNDPGLIVIAPSTPQDAYDLLIEAAALDDPVVFLEHIGLYGLRGGKTGWGDGINQIVDTKSINLAIEKNERYSIGKAKLIRGGHNLTIVTWGSMTHLCLKASEIMSNNGIEIEIIDLRTLVPFDAKTCVESVSRTGRLLVVQEGQWTGGFGHTVLSRIIEECFWKLESPPIVLGALDTPVPFSPPLENHTLVDVENIVNAIKKILP